MDPNEALAEMRTLCADMDELEGSLVVHHLLAMRDRFEALDEWLSKGGFLPADWRSDDEKAKEL